MTQIGPVHISFLLPPPWEMLSLKSWLYSAIEEIAFPRLGTDFFHPLKLERKLIPQTVLKVVAQPSSFIFKSLLLDHSNKVAKQG